VTSLDNINRYKILSEHLAQAESRRQGVEPLTSLNPNITIIEAYQVQLAAAVQAAPGDYFCARFAHLGEVHVKFAD
jgi:2-keto-4-pentenoate hydratase